MSIWFRVEFGGEDVACVCFVLNIDWVRHRTDSTAFDAKAYYEQFITTSSLPTLLKKENELLTGES